MSCGPLAWWRHPQDRLCMTKRPEEIALMAESGRLLAQVFGHLDGLNLIGMSTMQVNDLVDDFIVQQLNARPASKGQYGYAYALNASRNHVVCHGVPSCEDILQDGDIVNFDITLRRTATSPISARPIWSVRCHSGRSGSCKWLMKRCGRNFDRPPRRHTRRRGPRHRAACPQEWLLDRPRILRAWHRP